MSTEDMLACCEIGARKCQMEMAPAGSHCQLRIAVVLALVSKLGDVEHSDTR